MATMERKAGPLHEPHLLPSSAAMAREASNSSIGRGRSSAPMVREPSLPWMTIPMVQKPSNASLSWAQHVVPMARESSTSSLHRSSAAMARSSSSSSLNWPSAPMMARESSTSNLHRSAVTMARESSTSSLPWTSVPMIRDPSNTSLHSSVPMSRDSSTSSSFGPSFAAIGKFSFAAIPKAAFSSFPLTSRPATPRSSQPNTPRPSRPSSPQRSVSRSRAVPAKPKKFKFPKPSGRNGNSSKRRTFPLTDGWSVVTRGTPSSPTSTTAHHSARARADPDAYLLPHVTADTLRAQFEAFRSGREVGSDKAAWAETAFVAGLRGIVARVVEELRESGERIDEAVCLATGSFSEERVGWDGAARRRAMWQFVGFWEVCELLQSHGLPPPALYAQEPHYTTADLAFLSSLGVTAFRTNDAFRLTTPQSFVYAPFMGYSILFDRVLLASDPVLTVYNDLDEWMEKAAVSGKKKKYTERVGRWRGRREGVKLGEFGEGGLEGLGVYWRRGKGERGERGESDD